MLFIFFLIIAVFIEFLIGNPRVDSEEFDLVQREAVRAADSLMRSGYPHDWNSTHVNKAGFVDGGVLNVTKIAEFDLYTQNNGYVGSKRLIGVQHEYIITFTNHTRLTGTVPLPLPSAGVNNESAMTALEPRIIAVQDRLLLFDDAGVRKPVTMTVYVYSP